MGLTHRLALTSLGLLAVLAVNTGALAASGEYSAVLDTGVRCVDGTHTLRGESGFLGDLTLTVDARGRVSGTLSSLGAIEPVTGKLSVRSWGQKLSIKGGSGRTSFKYVAFGAGADLVGRFKDRGTYFSGRTEATLDLSSAPSNSVEFSVELETLSPVAALGSGEATVCARNITTLGLMRRGRADKLLVEGERFRFKGKGALTDDALILTSWKIKTHGISLRGVGGTVARQPLAPDVLLLTVSGHGVFIDPYLGEAYGPALTAAIAAEGERVEEFDFRDAGTSSSGDGYTGLLETLRFARDAWVVGRANPTRVVIVAHSHGGVWAHAALFAVPDLPVTALIDLDTNSCNWNFVGHAHPSSTGNPVSAFLIGETRFDAEDVVPTSVQFALEVQSTSTCPTLPPEPFDDATNVRPDGSQGIDAGLYVFQASEGHTAVDETTGSTYPVVRDWLLDVLAFTR